MKRNWTTISGKLAGLAIVSMIAGMPAAHAVSDDARRVLDFDSCAKPQYPKADLQAKHQGTVKLGFKADAGGTVTDSKVIESSGFASLDDAARTAIGKCRFSPAKDGGETSKWITVTYKWTLK